MKREIRDLALVAKRWMVGFEGRLFARLACLRGAPRTAKQIIRAAAYERRALKRRIFEAGF